MEAFKTAAKVYNVLEAKLKHSNIPLSMSAIMLCPDLNDAKQTTVRDCLRALHDRGKVRKVPIVTDNAREKVGFEWAAKTQGEWPANWGTDRTPVPVPAKAQESMRIRVNDDHSVTIITSKIKITIEVPE